MMEIERNKHETLLFSTDFNYWLCTLPNRNISIRLRVEYSILFRWSIRFQSNLDEIIQTRVYIRSIFNFDFSLAHQFYFLPILEPYLSGPICTMNYGQLDIRIYIYPSPFSTRKSRNPSQAFLIFSISNAIPRNTRWTSGCKVKHEKSSYARGRIWFTTQTLQVQF